MDLIYFLVSGEIEGWSTYLNNLSCMVFSFKRRRTSFVIRSWSRKFVQVSLD